MSKYTERLNASDDAKKQQEAILAQANAVAQLNKVIADATASTTRLAQAKEYFLSQAPFNFESYLGVEVEIAANDKRLATAKSLLETEFA